jgi:hypothetical protein
MNAERLKKMKLRKKKLKEGSEGGAFFFVKADQTIRIRALPVDENEELGLEVITFYLGQDIKRVVSPKTFGEPCAIYEAWTKYKDKNKELADKIKPKKMYVMPAIKYDDLKGGKINSMGAKLALLTPGAYQKVIDYSLDSEHGDPSDPKEGFDLKWTRTGSGLTDTEYSILNCKPTPLDKKYAIQWDTEKMIRKEIPSYERTKELLKSFLGDDTDRKKPSSNGEAKKDYKIVIRDGKRVKVKLKAKPKSDL